MKLINKLTLLPMLIFSVLLAASCQESSTSVDTETELEVHIVEDLPANVEAERGAAPDFTFYSLREGTIVTDSASTEWDIAFSATTILVNSGTSGPGKGGAVVLDMAFEEVETAPESGYQVDSAEGYAIDNWYSYTGQNVPQHAILPKENKTIVVNTADGNAYAKIQIISYYKGNPDTSSDKFANSQTRAEDRYYTFKYVVQTDGTRRLK
jgi:hypothetical protein